MTINERFVYDENRSESYNFTQWHLMNSEERESAGQAPYSQDMAREVFKILRSSGWLMTNQSAVDQENNANS
jgi:hypothetical protein